MWSAYRLMNRSTDLATAPALHRRSSQERRGDAQLVADAEKTLRARLETRTINLTQVCTSAELATALAGAVMDSAERPETVPVIFFDEFDTARDAAAYGWLSWFLVPMHDGEFLHG
jgi:hypothetical protein